MLREEKKKAIVMVEPYSTGRKLIEEFNDKDYVLIRIAPEKVEPESFQEQHDEQTKQNVFEKTIIFKNTEQVKKELEEYDVLHCFAGSEHGVSAAGEIAYALKLSTANDIAFLKAWRNKYSMATALNTAGVRSIPHFKSDNIEEMMKWAKSKESGFVENETPLVLKPLESAGTNDVFICKTEEDIRKAFQKIMSSKNVFGEINIEVLAQQYIKGTEYAVNAVARDGEIFVTDITEYGKKIFNGSPVYNIEKYLCPVKDKELFNELSDYLKKSAAALGIKNGPIHFEVKKPNDNHKLGNCVGVDMALRLPGDIDLPAIKKTMGYTQASVLREALLEPEKFKERVKAERVANKNLLWHVFLISEQEGKVVSDIQNEFKNIPGYFSGHIDIKPGSQLQITKDILTAPGYIVLTNNSEITLNTSYEAIRSMEQKIFKDCITSPKSWLEQAGDIVSSAIKHPAFPYVAAGFAAFGYLTLFKGSGSTVTKDLNETLKDTFKYR